MTQTDTTFDEAYFQRLHDARDHWWVRGMQEIAAALLGPAGPGLRILDAGCGSGALLPWLSGVAAPHRVCGVDLSPEALVQCRRMAPEADLARASVTDLPFEDARFDLCVNMDVLQHLTRAQESAAMAELWRVLRPGGRLLVRTNAAYGRSGVSQRDDWRLYRPEDLRAALAAGGFDVVMLTPVNMLQGLWASLPHRPGHRHDHGHGGEHEHSGATPPEWRVAGLGIPAPVHPLKNTALLTLLRGEARWLAGRRRTLPFGHSLYALARRPATAAAAGNAA